MNSFVKDKDNKTVGCKYGDLDFVPEDSSLNSLYGASLLVGDHEVLPAWHGDIDLTTELENWMVKYDKTPVV